MKVIIFGATGMVGQGVLRECLLDPAAERGMKCGNVAVDSASLEPPGKVAHCVPSPFCAPLI